MAAIMQSRRPRAFTNNSSESIRGLMIPPDEPVSPTAEPPTEIYFEAPGSEFDNVKSVMHDITELYKPKTSMRRTVIEKYIYNDKSYIVRISRLFSPSDIDKFEKEFRILADLQDSPYVMKMYAAALKNGVGYMLLEDVPGKTMYEWLKDDASSDKRNRIYSDLIKGLYDIHSKGYLHLDIKPENIWIPTDKTRPVFFIDFDLAVSISDMPSVLGIGGTKEYMASGKVFEPTMQHNLWALGRTIGEYNDISYPSGHGRSNYGVVTHILPTNTKIPSEKRDIAQIVNVLQNPARSSYSINSAAANRDLLVSLLEPETKIGAVAASNHTRRQRIKKMKRRYSRRV